MTAVEIDVSDDRTAEVLPAVAASTKGQPWWLSGPCPSWCVSSLHRDHDFVDDRVHASHSTEVKLTTMEPTIIERNDYYGGPWYLPCSLLVGIEQQYLEAAPRVRIGETNRRAESEWEFTLAEAEQLGQALLQAVRLATESADSDFPPAGRGVASSGGDGRG